MRTFPGRARRLALLRRQRGLSIVEIMVGVMIGLIGIVVIFQVLTLSEERKRTTGSGSDAQVAGSIAIFSLERDLKLAGYGLGTSTALGCTVQAYDGQRAVTSFSFPFAPVTITHGAAGAPDSISVLYGNSPLFVTSQGYTTATATSKRTQGRSGLLPGDVVVVATSATPPTCALAEITSNTDADGMTVDHEAGSYTNAQGNTVTARYNPAAGSPIATGAGSLHNLGALPRLHVWRISNNRLQFVDDLHWTGAAGTAVEIAEGIINLQAQYGVDANNNNRVEANEWIDTAPADLTSLLAVRVALLARSQHFEKQAVTTAAPAWAAGNFTMTNVDGSTDSAPGNANDWRHYRYRVYQAVIPLRNVIWGTT